ncbi:MAG: glutathione peroxidase [Pseudomonadota bacterium]
MRRWVFAMVFGLMGMASATASASTAHDFEFTSIDGEAMPLAQFEGQPVLVVNTASRCGFTPQYDGLQALWTKYRDQGLVVIGVPSGDFNQELASEADVKEFCEVNFSLDFPMTEINHVKGEDAHPFFAWAGAQQGAPRWNFYKYLVGPDGTLVKSYGSVTRPMSRKLTSEIERLLATN